MIIIDGQIGVGKTTLAEKMESTWGISLYPELSSPDSGVILDRFYKDQLRWSFTSQVHFLINRYQMIMDIQGQSKKRGLLDRSIYGDAIFAEVQHDEGYMSREEFNTYSSLLNCFLEQIIPPKLLIYLDCSVEVAIKRIGERDRNCERKISKDYLEKINSKYLSWYHTYQASPKLFINTDNLNIHEEEGAKRIMGMVQEALRDI